VLLQNFTDQPTILAQGVWPKNSTTQNRSTENIISVCYISKLLQIEKISENAQPVIKPHLSVSDASKII